MKKKKFYVKNAIKVCVHNMSIRRYNKQDIDRSVKHSKVIEGFDNIDYYEPEERFDTHVEVLNMTIEQAVPFYNGPDTCILNSGSFLNPGGNYLSGSMGQEESLCHVSTLYSVLRKNKKYFKEHSKYVNDGLLYDTSIYTPYIRFDKAFCNVLTVSAPDLNTWAVAKQNDTVPTYLIRDNNNTTLRQRIDFALGCMKFHNQRVLIIGAFGCEVGQQPVMVASIFHEMLETKYHGIFEKVIFTIPNDSTGRHNAFKYVFEKNGLYNKESKMRNYEVPLVDTNDNVEILHIKAIDKMEAYKAVLMLIDSRGVQCEDGILDNIIEVSEKSYLTVEDIIKRL